MKNYKKVFIVFLLVLLVGVLVACGKNSYEVTFNADNNSDAIVRKVNDGDKVSKPADPKKDNYEFIGWYLGEEEFDFEKPITSDLTLIAKWEAVIKVTVTFNVNGGNETIEALEINKGSKATKPADPTKADSTFIGWHLGDVLFDFETEVNESITLIAKWEIEGYYVTYNFNYNNKTEVVKVEANELLQGIDIEPREGYAFIGWFKDDVIFMKEWNFATEKMPEADLTLYAYWVSAPIIKGFNDFHYNIGDEVPDIYEGVTAFDIIDGDLEVIVNEGDLDFTVPGVYQVEYKAINLDYRETVETITVTVVYENRLIVNENNEFFLQVKEDVLGFVIELAYTGTLDNVQLNAIFADWISDIHVEDGVIIIAATGLEAIDAYLLTEILKVTNVETLEITSVLVDTVVENNLKIV